MIAVSWVAHAVLVGAVAGLTIAIVLALIGRR